MTTSDPREALIAEAVKLLREYAKESDREGAYNHYAHTTQIARQLEALQPAPVGWKTEAYTYNEALCRSATHALAAEERRGAYVASRASVLERGAMWRRYRDAGAPIIASWIDEDGPNDTADLDELWVRICGEVTSAERLILYVEPSDFPLKGAFVEIGMALAASVPIFIVAPGVEISGRNQRPFGSWIKHPSVTFCETVDEAFAAPSVPLPSEEG